MPFVISEKMARKTYTNSALEQHFIIIVHLEGFNVLFNHIWGSGENITGHEFTLYWRRAVTFLSRKEAYMDTPFIASLTESEGAGL
jgi:hypothetical protein